MTTSRKTLALRQFVGVALALFAVLFTLGLCHCNALTPAEQAKVASDGVKLSACAAAAHLCKVANKIAADIDAGDAGVSECWDQYEACMTANGFRDGGAK